MPRVRLKRLASTNEGGLNDITGDTTMKPVVGLRFALFFEENGTAKIFTASVIESVIGDTFRTENSTYEYQVLD